MNTTIVKPSSTERDNGLIFSFIAHAFLVVYLVLKTVFWNTDAVDYQSAIRVDLVALPDKDLNSPAPTAAQESPPPAPVIEETKTEALPEKKPLVDEEAIKLDSAKKAEDLKHKQAEEKRKKEALEKIKKLSALESIKSSVETERIEKMVGQSESKVKTYKGNVLSPGTELTGINKIQHENYVALIDRQIKENWTLPQWMAKKDFKAQALLRVDKDGNIVLNQIYKSSGNPNYDDVVIETIRKSGPFPKPPEKFLAILAEKGILIGFPE